MSVEYSVERIPMVEEEREEKAKLDRVVQAI